MFVNREIAVAALKQIYTDAGNTWMHEVDVIEGIAEIDAMTDTELMDDFYFTGLFAAVYPDVHIGDVEGFNSLYV